MDTPQYEFISGIRAQQSAWVERFARLKDYDRTLVEESRRCVADSMALLARTLPQIRR